MIVLSLTCLVEGTERMDDVDNYLSTDGLTEHELVEQYIEHSNHYGFKGNEKRWGYDAAEKYLRSDEADPNAIPMSDLNLQGFVDSGLIGRCRLCGKYIGSRRFYWHSRRLFENFKKALLCEDCINPNTKTSSKRKCKKLLLGMKEILGDKFNHNYIKIFQYLDLSLQEKIITLLRKIPNISLFTPEYLFGSFKKAIKGCEIPVIYEQETARGTHCYADDKHFCLSYGEQAIDNLLYKNNIPHEKEPHYPKSKYRADFKVNNAFIEFWGLAGNKEYDKKIVLKREICKKNNIRLIEIFPKDLDNLDGVLKQVQQNI